MSESPFSQALQSPIASFVAGALLGGFAGYNVGFEYGAESMKVRLDEMERRMIFLEQRLMTKPETKPAA